MPVLEAKKITVPQQIISDGSTQEFFAVKNPAGQTLWAVKADGSVAGSKAQQAKLTAPVVAAASMTFTDPGGSSDYAFATATTSTPAGFSTVNEANSVLKALQNAILRIEQLEARLTAAGILSAT